MIHSIGFRGGSQPIVANPNDKLAKKPEPAKEAVKSVAQEGAAKIKEEIPTGNGAIAQGKEVAKKLNFIA